MYTRDCDVRKREHREQPHEVPDEGHVVKKKSYKAVSHTHRTLPLYSLSSAHNHTSVYERELHSWQENATQRLRREISHSVMQ